MRITIEAFHALLFARNHPGWHSYSSDATTLKAIRWLAARGYVHVNRYGQFCAATPSGEAIEQEVSE